MALTQTEITKFFTVRGWDVSNFGHLTKTLSNGRTYRIYFQAKTMRWEVKVNYDNGTFCWVRLKTSYYSSVEFKEGRLIAFCLSFK